MHGIKTNLLTSAARSIAAVSTAVIGIVATGGDADANEFPLDQPRLITDVRAAIGKAGTTGTLKTALSAIADITSARVVVVRVAVDAVDQNGKVLGTTAGSAYTGMQALLTAEAKTGVRPRILGAPGLDTEAVTNGLVSIAKRLRGFVYAMAEGDDRDEAVAYANEFGDRELMLFWPATSAGNADTIGRALGMRAWIDQTQGWQKTISNVVVTGVTGIGKDVSWSMDDESTDAAVLNEANITTLVCFNGYRFWGNRTMSSEPLFAFESAVRTSQVLQDTFQDGLFWAMDKPITAGLIKDMISTVNGVLRKMVANSQIIGGKCWYDPAKNSGTDLGGGQLALDYDFTPCAPLEGLTENQVITDTYYADLSSSISSGTAAA
ncbi:phage tail protein [Sphingomonas sp. S-NIH.Pt3_0716]|nr:phage tail protein [Sphingomonas sp. S-NIH.Pt3_0716]